MSAPGAADRARRLLSLIPWLEQNHPSGADIGEVAARYGYPPADLVRDLTDVVNFVSADPYQSFLLFEILVTEDQIRVERNDLLGKPMRMDPADLAALVAAGRAVAALLEVDELGPLEVNVKRSLERAVAKLAGARGSEAEAVQIRLAAGDEPVLQVIREGIGTGHCIDIDYYSYGRDVETSRVVEPHRCLYDGFWYLMAHCRLAEAPRVFRLDRVRRAELTDEVFQPPDDVAEAMDGIPVDGSLPEVTLLLDPGVRWVVDQYPHTGQDSEPDGRLRVTLPVTADRWLERLLLRLGPAAEVVVAPPGLGTDLRAAAARRVLARYR
ncbi:MAG: WYL domain-containing protein [Acidimicrobiales bacterium]|nr:WYL domain-containing protein [Acidimicrobiales bacterium]